MTNQDIGIIKEAVSVLIGKPLTDLDRARAMIVVDFGELVETDVVQRNEYGESVRDEKGRLVYTKGMRGRYALQALCSMRFTCGDDVIFASDDILLPSTRVASRSDFDWQTFNWGIEGNNSFDELVARHFIGGFGDYIVKDAKVSRLGDLTILFENDFVLELFSNYSRNDENWCLYELGTDNALTVLGNGVEER